VVSFRLLLVPLWKPCTLVHVCSTFVLSSGPNPSGADGLRSLCVDCSLRMDKECWGAWWHLRLRLLSNYEATGLRSGRHIGNPLMCLCVGYCFFLDGHGGVADRRSSASHLTPPYLSTHNTFGNFFLLMQVIAGLFHLAIRVFVRLCIIRLLKPEMRDDSYDGLV
jgi:hypothetical protein